MVPKHGVRRPVSSNRATSNSRQPAPNAYRPSRSRRPHRSSDKPRSSLAEYHSRYKYVPDDLDSNISPCVKYSLFFFNFVFWLIGTLMIGLGAWSFSEEVYEYGFSRIAQVNNLLHLMLHISLALMIVGSITFLMSFFGCVGALRENICLLKLYSFMLLFLFIGEVVLSTVAFLSPNTFLQYFQDGLSKELVMNYRGDKDLSNLIDSMQIGLKCCGLTENGFRDWSYNEYFNCSMTNLRAERCSVPYSCCRNYNTSSIPSRMCGDKIQDLSQNSTVEINNIIYTRGCIVAFTELFEKNMNVAGIFCLSCALIQLFAMFLARSLQGQIYEQISRWM